MVYLILTSIIVLITIGFYFLGSKNQKVKSELEAYKLKEKIDNVTQENILEASKHWDKRRNDVKSWMRGKTVKNPPTTKSVPRI